MIIMHEKTKLKYSISKTAKTIETEMTDLKFTPSTNNTTAENAKVLKQEIKKELVKRKNSRWRSKQLHGEYPSLIGEPHVDSQNTNNWLRSDIKGETEGLLTAARSSSIHVKLSEKYSWQ